MLICDFAYQDIVETGERKVLRTTSPSFGKWCATSEARNRPTAGVNSSLKRTLTTSTIDTLLILFLTSTKAKNANFVLFHGRNFYDFPISTLN